MEKAGFKLERLANELAIMKGTFTGEEVDLIILASPKSKTTWKVLVDYPAKDSWSSLKSNYFKMVELYEKKYGAPESRYEFFTTPYYEGDGFELQALEKENCRYLTLFETGEGTIGIAISKYGNIQIGYEDEINAEIDEKEEEENSIEDI